MGMTLYQLVSLREQLKETYNVNNIVAAIETLRVNITLVKQYPIKARGQYEEYINTQLEFYQTLINTVTQECTDMQHVIEQINADIEIKQKELFSGTYELDLIKSMNEYETRLPRSRAVDSGAQEILLERLRGYTDFHFPALEIGCKIGQWTNHLVAADPLYVVDIDQRFLNQTVAQFNEVYRNRLRQYLIELMPAGEKNLAQTYRLYNLPQGQFGFIFSWEFFNYLPVSVLKYYIPQFYDLLRPGGVVLFHYNNGDTPNGASYAEGRWQSYMPGCEIINLCQQSGFEILQTVDLNQGEISWIEIKKPGDLKTAKASQAMGAIR